MLLKRITDTTRPLHGPFAIFFIAWIIIVRHCSIDQHRSHAELFQAAGENSEELRVALPQAIYAANRSSGGG